MGLPYGIANQVGKPAYETVRGMVALAFERGINAFDTAALYGDSEAVVRQVIKELRLRDKAFVATKLPWLTPQALQRSSSATAFVLEALQHSLDRLGLEQIPLCLLHRYDDLPHLPALLAASEKGIVRHAGVSVYYPQQALRALETSGVAAIQLTTSLFDLRFWRAGVFGKAREKGLTLFVRSIYLQGLLFLTEERIPPELEECKPARRELEALAAAWDLSPAELAFRFVLSLPGAGGLVVGMESQEQCRSNLAYWKKGPLPGPLLEKLLKELPHLPERIVNPSYWPRS